MFKRCEKKYPNGDNPGSDDRRLITPIYVLMNILNFIIMTANNLYILYPLRLQDIGKTSTQTGYIMAAYALAGVASRAVIGHHIDRIGRKFFVRLGIAMTIIVAILYSLPVKNDLYLMFIRALHGFGYGFYFTAAFTWAADYAPAGRMAESLGIFGISGLLTSASGSFVGGFILKHTGNNYNMVFLAAITMGFIGLFMSVWMKEFHKPRHEEDGGSFFDVLRRPEVLRTALIALAFGLSHSAIIIYMPPFMRFRGFGNVAFFFLAYSSAAVLVRLFAGKAADRLGRLALLTPGFLDIAVCQFLIHGVQSASGLLVLGFFLGCAHGMVYPAINAMMMDRVESFNRGKGTGIFQASVDTGFILGSSFYGMLIDLQGYSKTYAASGVIIGSLLMVFIISEALSSSFKPCPKED